MYKGGTYQNQPRAKRTFSVFIAEEELFEKNKALETISATVTKVVALLDHEIASNQALVKLKGDSSVPMEGTGITAMELVFEIEDY